MEEFKNLKEIIELSEEEINNNDENVSAVLDLVDLKELRNLIARYKELEEENKNYKIINETLNNSYNSLEKTQKLLNAQFKKINTEIQDLCIPKSKVKEILNKLSNHNYKCNFDDVDFLQNIIIEIHQLLED